jgi:hypothetical protein
LRGGDKIVGRGGRMTSLIRNAPEASYELTPEQIEIREQAKK